MKLKPWRQPEIRKGQSYKSLILQIRKNNNNKIQVYIQNIFQDTSRNTYAQLTSSTM